MSYKYWYLHSPAVGQLDKRFDDFEEMCRTARAFRVITGAAPTYSPEQYESLCHFTEEQLTEPAKAATFQLGDRVVLNGIPSPVMIVTGGPTPDTAVVAWFKNSDIQHEIFPLLALKKAD